MKVIGVGLGRTGTSSLRAALELLLGQPCYHMTEAIEHPEHLEFWRAAARSERVDWAGFFAGYGATVDWPGAAFWSELAQLYPDALILLSTRESPEAWWTSADATIFAGLRQPADRPQGPGVAWRHMWDDLARHRFPVDTTDADAARRRLGPALPCPRRRRPRGRVSPQELDDRVQHGPIAEPSRSATTSFINVRHHG